MVNGDPVIVSTKPVVSNGIHSDNANNKRQDIGNQITEGSPREKFLPPDGGVQVVSWLT